MGDWEAKACATRARRTKAELQPPPSLPPAELFVTLCLGRRGKHPPSSPSPIPRSRRAGSLPLPLHQPYLGRGHSSTWSQFGRPAPPGPSRPAFGPLQRRPPPPTPAGLSPLVSASRLPHLPPPSRGPLALRLPWPPPPPRPPEGALGEALLGGRAGSFLRPLPPAPAPEPGARSGAPPPEGGRAGGGAGVRLRGGPGVGGAASLTSPGRAAAERAAAAAAGGGPAARASALRGAGGDAQGPGPPRPRGLPPPPPRSPAPGPGPHCVRREAARPIAWAARRGWEPHGSGSGSGAPGSGDRAGTPGAHERR